MRVFHVELKMTIPNALSILRILLLPVFVWLYLESFDRPEMLYWAFGVLVLSGITDSLDGIIARRCNQITDFGKILDPVADKLTQVTVVICLALRYSDVVYLVGVCLFKEVFQAVGGLILLKRGEKVQGARWYGKVSTFTFYGAMAILVLLGDRLPRVVVVALVAVVALVMVFAFVKYLTMFCRLQKVRTHEDEASSADVPSGHRSE